MSPITGSGNEKPVYDVFTSPPFQNVSKLQKFVLNVLVQASRGLSLGCVLLKSSANTQRLGCSDRILKAIAMWYKYNLFDGLAYNTSGYFASCVVFFPELRRGEEKCEQWAKCPLLLIYAKPSNKKFIIPPQKKKMLFCNWLLFFGKSIQKHSDSVCENNVNNEQNVRPYHMPNHWMRGWLSYCKRKMLSWLLFSSKGIQNIWFFQQ